MHLAERESCNRIFYWRNEFSNNWKRILIELTYNIFRQQEENAEFSTLVL